MIALLEHISNLSELAGQEECPIEECPAHNKLSSTGQRLQFAPRRKATCTCGYHRPISAMIYFFNFAYVATFIIIIIQVHPLHVCVSLGQGDTSSDVSQTAVSSSANGSSTDTSLYHVG